MRLNRTQLHQPRVHSGGPHFRLRAGGAAAVAAVQTEVAIEPRGLRVKRVLDFVLAFALLVVLAVPMLVVAAMIKLTSRGPVLYRQQRVGLNGRVFELLKFRTMRVDAESASGPVWARQGDPRCTPIGKWLRRLSIDELPQLVNVLRGEMSLVGPRPERPFFVEQFSRDLPGYAMRHAVMPGMTGWAQVNGLRGATSIERRLDYDLYYVRNRSLWMDLYILAITPFKIFRDPNAY